MQKEHVAAEPDQKRSAGGLPPDFSYGNTGDMARDLLTPSL
ncbi:MAG: hypothetical protein ACKO5E_21530 [bacterium]